MILEHEKGLDRLLRTILTDEAANIDIWNLLVIYGATISIFNYITIDFC